MKYPIALSRIVLFTALTISMPVGMASAQATGEEFGSLGEEMNLEDLLSLDVMVTSASKIKQTIAEAPSIISVITRRQIETRNYRSVAEALGSVPGLYINTDYVFKDVGVRGTSGEMRGASRLVKVVINGQATSFRSETTNFIGPEMIPMSAVERIEIIRGPASALYGANAFLGVINVVTRKGADIDGASVTLRASDLHGRHGYDLGLLMGKDLGAADLVLSIQKNQTDRSGLKIPCGTPYADTADPCATHRSEVNDPDIFDRWSRDDVTSPFSLLATADIDVSELFGGEEEQAGILRLQVNYQEINSSANFTDWAMLEFDTYADLDENIYGYIGNSGNRVGLFNTTMRTEYEYGFWDDRATLLVSHAYAEGGVTDSERLRKPEAVDFQDNWPQRARYGYSGNDVTGELRLRLLDEYGELDWGDGMSLVKNLIFIVAADHSWDTISYSENKNAIPNLYTESDLTNLGVLAQVTGSLFGERVGFTGGLRYDSHTGAELSNTQQANLASLNGNAALEELCDGKVCYDSLNYRAGLTVALLKDVGEAFGGTLVNDLYLKALYGTAFKAPGPSFLYHSDYIGSALTAPNPGLRPQDVTSLEFLLGMNLFDNALHTSLVFFLNSLKGKVAFESQVGGIIANNSNDVNSCGLEGTLLLRLSPVEWETSVSFQSSERIFDDQYAENNPNVFAYPELTLHSNLAVDVEWIYSRVELQFHFVGTREGHWLNVGADREEQAYSLDPYYTFDVNVVSEPLNIWGDGAETVLSLSVRNLLDTKYEYPGFNKHYGVDLPGEPRAVFLGVKQNF